MFKFLNKPIIKNTTVTYKKIIVAIFPTIIVLFVLYPDRFKGDIFKTGFTFILIVFAAAIIAALLQKISNYVIKKKLKK